MVVLPAGGGLGECAGAGRRVLVVVVVVECHRWWRRDVCADVAETLGRGGITAGGIPSVEELAVENQKSDIVL